MWGIECERWWCRYLAQDRLWVYYQRWKLLKAKLIKYIHSTQCNLSPQLLKWNMAFNLKVAFPSKFNSNYFELDEEKRFIRVRRRRKESGLTVVKFVIDDDDDDDTQTTTHNFRVSWDVCPMSQTSTISSHKNFTKVFRLVPLRCSASHLNLIAKKGKNARDEDVVAIHPKLQSKTDNKPL